MGRVVGNSTLAVRMGMRMPVRVFSAVDTKGSIGCLIQVSGEGMQASGRGIQVSAKGIQVVFEGIQLSGRGIQGFGHVKQYGFSQSDGKGKWVRVP